MTTARRFVRCAALALAMVGGTTLAAAQSLQPTTRAEALDWLADRLAQIVRPGERLDALKDKARMQIYLMADMDGGGVSRSDYELLMQVHKTSVRAQRLMQWANLDLDGDGRVTRAEAERGKMSEAVRTLRPQGIAADPTREQIAAILDKLVAPVMSQDADGDGVVTLAEVLAAARVQAEHEAATAMTALLHMRMVPLVLDRNGDGIVSAAEFDAATDEAFAAIDADGDGAISQEEMAHARQRGGERAQHRQRVAAAATRAKTCALPRPPAGARVVQLGAYEGEALSSVSLGGDEVETTVAQIAIEPGTEPLYITAASHDAMIWQLTGATQRVVMFIVSSRQYGEGGRPRVGVTGLAADRVYVPPQVQCLQAFNNTKGNDGLSAKGDLTAMLGRAADDVIGVYKLSKVALPSGIVSPDAPYPNKLQTPDDAPGAALWKEMLQFAPGGVAVNEPERIVSPLKVRRYEVLPQEAGLAQLLDEGALEVAGHARVITIGPGPTERGTVGDWARKQGARTVPTEFRIVRKMRFPAGLSGAHSVRFILARGVPMPDGSPGHSTVISEETGQPVRTR